MRNRRRIGIIALIILIVVVGLVVRARRSGGKEPEIRTATATRQDIISSVSGNGILQPVTTVEVKSNVGGQIVELAVDEGDIVRAGQLIAKIDPSDSRTNLEQAEADLASAMARVNQASQGEQMQRKQTTASVRAAEQAVVSARKRLEQATRQAQVQPRLTGASISQARSSLESAEASLKQTKTALIPQKTAAAQSAYDQAKANYDQAEKNLARQKALLEKGFVAKSQVDTAEQQYSVSKAQLDSARNKLDTVKDEAQEDLNAAEARVAQARAALDSADANRVQDELKQQEMEAAQAALRQAEAQLDNARTGSYQEQIKREEITQTMAQVERSRAAVRNARTQVGYTTITAPRSGVVVKKYVEEGSIVTAGRSSFSGTGAGVALVEIADINRMLVKVNIDETDIAQITLGQNVDISVDAYPDEQFTGIVTSIAPKAIIEQNVTTVPVEVEMLRPDPKLKPEMNATCDFIIQRRDSVIAVPSEAVKETNEGMVVTVVEGEKQVERPVKVGIEGEDHTEIISGLQEGETVVTAVFQPMAGFSDRSGDKGSKMSGAKGMRRMMKMGKGGGPGSRGGGGKGGGGRGGHPF